MKDSGGIDIEKMNRIAEELGIKVTKNSSSPGIYLTENGKRKKMDAISLLMAIFPELKSDLDNIKKRDEEH
ncbi:hypothetical protein [Paenibacillus sp. 1781tsa1]|uniref:hypothetical protein n=1 Tax=Paenibacillus sp. 1781tsa1 TaxID=2953810 RepID=UPI00209F2D93|nr:hypothetical protein [Paenibacillus sp. 1781tsa1]MCP1184996.1 hypothetical protein [Paenibacillus sp. 1781tsa1]